MGGTATSPWQLLKETVRDFVDDDCPSMAAALSYYTVFSLPPLLVLLLLLLGALLDPQDVQGTLETRIRVLMGPAGGDQIRTILAHAQRPGSGIMATALGAVALVAGAAGVFGQLQAALNKAWKVAPDPQRGGTRQFLLKRAFSLGMVLGLAFVLLVSLVLSAMLSAFSDSLARLLPQGLSATLLQGINFAVSFGVTALLFAAIFKVLPDARIAWRTCGSAPPSPPCCSTAANCYWASIWDTATPVNVRSRGRARADVRVDLLLLDDCAAGRRVSRPGPCGGGRGSSLSAGPCG